MRLTETMPLKGHINLCPAEPGYTLPLQTEEANWSGSALFAIKYLNLKQ